MGILFISHSNADNAAAIRVRDYLREQGWSQFFLDLDPEQGIAPGHRWQQELRQAGERCSGVVLLLSPNWVMSRWCQTEFLVADQLGKKIFPVMIAPVPLENLPYDLQGRFQIADASSADREFDGLKHLSIGLRRAGLDPNSFRWPPADDPSRCVYRGLQSLEEEDAAIFFGREGLITKALDAIRRLRSGSPERMLIVLGASGAGKSSFLKAGIIARLRRDEDNFLVLPTIRPERAALSGRMGLAASLQSNPEQISGVRDVVERFSDLRRQATEHLLRFAESVPCNRARQAPTIILPLDQAEELFVPENQEAVCVLDLISEAIRADSNAILVATIRSDSFERFQQESRFAEIPLVPFSLPPLPMGAFKEVIEGPSRLANPPLAVEPQLSDRLLEDLAAEDALPLLAFTLERLSALHPRGGKLTLKQYEQEFGGLQGAITAAVDVAFSAARRDPALPQIHSQLEALARAAFIPALVYLEGASSEPRRRVEPFDALPESTKPLVRHFVDQRLLVCHKTIVEGRETDTVEVTHEAILRQWPALRSWIAEERSALHALEAARAAAMDWRGHATTGKGDGPGWLIHRGARLEEAEALARRADFSAAIESALQQYLNACRKQENADRLRERESLLRTRRLQRRIWLLLSAATAVVFLTGVIIVQLFGTLTSQIANTLAARAAIEADARNYDRATRYAAAALSRGGWGPLVRASSVAIAELQGAATASSALAVFRGHTNQVIGADFSPDGKRIVTASRDKTARIWDTQTARQLMVLRGHTGAVLSAEFSPDGKQIATASEDNTAIIWNATNGKEIVALRGHQGVLFAASFNPDGSRVVTASDDKTARIWDSRSGQQLMVLAGHEDYVDAAEFSHDGAWVITASADKTARVWNAKTGEPGLILREAEGVNGAEFSPNGKQIVTASDDKTAAIWDATSGKEIARLMGQNNNVLSARFDASGRYVVTASPDRTVRLWNANDAHEVAAFYGHDAGVNWAAFDASGQRIVSASDDFTARLWSARPDHRVTVLRGHTGNVLSAAFSPDGKRVITGSGDRTARIWNAQTGEKLGTLEGHRDFVEAVAFSPEGRLAGTASDDGTARIWDASSGKQILSLQGHRDAVYGIAFSHDGRYIVTASRDRTARVWDANSGRKLVVLRGHAGAIYSASFSPDGQRIVTASADRAAMVWDAKTGARLSVLRGHEKDVSTAQYSPDGRWIVTGSRDATVCVWDAGAGQQRLILRGHTGAIMSAAYDHSGTRIVTAALDKTVRLWDAKTGHELARLRGHTDNVNSASFSEDGQWVVSASDDGTARIWAVGRVSAAPAERLPAQICLSALANGLSRFSTSEVRAAQPALDPMNTDACHPPGSWTRLKQLLLPGYSLEN
ncbi:MAG TPA: TIR domain-containing protein [Rhizomicrobium sp.]|nr:TIR domain-containing protein [Rhizomicrobium sp.]